jgi:hypothetical protein
MRAKDTGSILRTRRVEQDRSTSKHIRGYRWSRRTRLEGCGIEEAFPDRIDGSLAGFRQETLELGEDLLAHSGIQDGPKVFMFSAANSRAENRRRGRTDMDRSVICHSQSGSIFGLGALVSSFVPFH